MSKAFMSSYLVGESIGYPCLSPPAVVVIHFQRSFSPKLLGILKSNFMWSLSELTERNFVRVSKAYDEVALTPIYGEHVQKPSSPEKI